MHETKDLALAFCLLWFIANWTVNASLSYTSVASATILSSMSGMPLCVIFYPNFDCLFEAFLLW